jgi:hypothetical protein
MSLYEVSDLVPGESFRARDLIRGGTPVLVSEHTATRTLKPWERIAARIVHQGPKMILAGGLLAFTLEASLSLFAQLTDRYPNAVKRPRRRAPPLNGLEGWNGTDGELRQAAPLFTTAWLFDVLPRVLGTNRPTLLNSEVTKSSSTLSPFHSHRMRRGKRSCSALINCVRYARKHQPYGTGLARRPPFPQDPATRRQ